MYAICLALALQTAQPAPPQWDAALRWTVGAADPGPVFAAILSAAVDQSGTAYVLDSVDPFVHEISASGRLVRSFGALGDGPASSASRAASAGPGSASWSPTPCTTGSRCSTGEAGPPGPRV